mmetsp:Transcript_124568/g.338366  ORF Transcript_124568/g.338366 Transcript_124568/m.338366 type:complete len:225 (-) Transcript_124568:830-1504(-)
MDGFSHISRFHSVDSRVVGRNDGGSDRVRFRIHSPRKDHEVPVSRRAPFGNSWWRKDLPHIHGVCRPGASKARQAWQGTKTQGLWGAPADHVADEREDEKVREAAGAGRFLGLSQLGGRRRSGVPYSSGLAGRVREDVRAERQVREQRDRPRGPDRSDASIGPRVPQQPVGESHPGDPGGSRGASGLGLPLALEVCVQVRRWTLGGRAAVFGEDASQNWAEGVR